MIKVKHKFLYMVYSDWNLNHSYSPYEKKYNYSCGIEIAGETVLCHVNSDNKYEYVSSLRSLVSMKHEAIKRFSEVPKPASIELPLGISIMDKSKMGRKVT